MEARSRIDTRVDPCQAFGMLTAAITDADRAAMRDLQARIDALGRRIRWSPTEAEGWRLEAERVALLREQAERCRHLGFRVIAQAG